MKKLFLSLLIALCTVCALFGFAACGETENNPTPGGNQGGNEQNIPQSYSVTVECGEGGSYRLSHESPVAAGTQVTLTVTTQTGYSLSSVTKNGEAVNLVNGRHVFTPSADTAFVITFDKLYTVSVDCGANGNYTISPENLFYRKNTEVTLSLLPNTGYEVDTVTVNGTAVEIENNEYTFNVTADTEISVTFKALVSVTVTCGSGGSYELSPTGGIYSAGTLVTLTLLPHEGYEVQSFTVNGTDKTEDLVENVYSFTAEANTNIVVRYYLPEDETALDIMVTCGNGGNYELSPKAPYHAGDDVALTVTPASGYSIQSVKVGGQDVTSQLGNNAYTIHLTESVQVEITFKEDLFSADYIGTWTSIVSSGTLPNELIIEANSFTFNGESYTPTKNANGYSFDALEGRDTITYSFALRDTGDGKNLLILTFKVSGADQKQYCTKEGTDYSFTFPEELHKNWYGGVNGTALTIEGNTLMLGDDTAVILSYNAETKTYLLLAGGIEYTLVYDAGAETLTLTAVENSRNVTVYVIAPDVVARLFTEFAGYRYTNGVHTVIIEENGAFNFDGKIYECFPEDTDRPKGRCKFSYSGGMMVLSINAFSATISNTTTFEIELKRVTGEEAYTVTVDCGDNGSYELTKPASGKDTYAAYEKVTLTISPAEGYKLHLFTFDGSDITATITENKYEFYISKNVAVELEFIEEETVEDLFPETLIATYSGRCDQGFEMKLVIEANRITVTVNEEVFEIERDGITVTDGTPTGFTFTVELGDYGSVTFERLKSTWYVSNKGYTLGATLKKSTK